MKSSRYFHLNISNETLEEHLAIEFIQTSDLDLSS
jgi:hypothetical protein